MELFPGRLFCFLKRRDANPSRTRARFQSPKKRVLEPREVLLRIGFVSIIDDAPKETVGFT